MRLGEKDIPLSRIETILVGASIELHEGSIIDVSSGDYNSRILCLVHPVLRSPEQLLLLILLLPSFFFFFLFLFFLFFSKLLRNVPPNYLNLHTNGELGRALSSSCC